MLSFLSLFLFSLSLLLFVLQAEEESVGPFYALRGERKKKGKLRGREREKGEGEKIENNGLGLVYRHFSRPNRYIPGNPMFGDARRRLQGAIMSYMKTLGVNVQHLREALKQLYTENHLGKAPSVDFLVKVFKHRYIAGNSEKARRRLRSKYTQLAFQVKSLLRTYTFTKRIKTLESRLRNEKKQDVEDDDDDDDEDDEDCRLKIDVKLKSLVESVLAKQDATTKLPLNEALYWTKKSDLGEVFSQVMPDFSKSEVERFGEELVKLKTKKGVTEEDIWDKMFDIYNTKETSDTETESGEESVEKSDESGDESDQPDKESDEGSGPEC